MAVNTLELRQEMGRTVTEATVILDLAAKEKRGMTEAEQVTVNEKRTRADSLKATIAQAEEFNALDISLDQPVKRGQRPTARTEVHDNNEDAPFDGPTPAAQFGHMLQLVRHAAASPSAIDPRLQKRAALGANENVGSEGGFLVGTDVSGQILQEMHDVGVLAPLCTEVPISANSNGIEINGIDETSRANGSRFGGVLAYWSNEAGTTTATKPKFRKLNLKLSKLFALYYATDEVIADASALGRLASLAFGEEIQFKVDDSIWEGTGAGMPVGIIGHPSVVSVAKRTGQAAATFVYENAVDMRSRMPARARAKAAWYINVDVEPQLHTMNLAVGTGGAPVFMPPGGASEKPYSTLLGLPVVPIEFASTLGTVGDVVLADFGQYLLATKGGLQQAESMHVQFLTGEMTYRFTYRCDGQPARQSPMTPFKGTKTQSPFITLDTRS